MGKYKIIPSSRTIVRSPISIGHKAEKGVQAIEFDLTAWVETYGSGTLTVIMRRWGDEIPYPVALELDENNKATWTLSDIDTAKAGMAYAQLNYIVGDEVVKKSDIYTFRVMDSLTGEGEPPEAYESWLEQLTHLAAEAMAEVLGIEGIVTDKTLTVDGGIADAKATGNELSALKADLGDLDERVDALESGGGGSGLTDAVKTALLQLAQKVAYIDDGGQDYYDDLYDALYAITAITLNTNSISMQTIGATSQLAATTTPAGGSVTWSSSNTSVATVSSTGLVTSVAYGSATITATAGSVSATCSVVVARATCTGITASYTQSGTVYDNASLDDLKSDLVVTASWSNGTTSTLNDADYTLSGSLTEGTSTITVSYGGKTTTFNVTVTAAPTLTSISAVYTQSGTVYDTDSLDSLKSDLVLTANYSDSSTSTLSDSDYTLSGTLTAGTSTITVTYGGKTTTFSVTVAANPYLAYWDFTQSLVDTVNGYEFTLSCGSLGTLERTSEGLVFSAPDTGGYNANAQLPNTVTFPKGSKLTIEFGASDAQMTSNSGDKGPTYGFGNGSLMGGVASIYWRGSSEKFYSYGSSWTDRWISTAPDYFNNKTLVIEVASDRTRTLTVDGVAFGTVPGSAISSDTYTFFFGRKASDGQTFHNIKIKKVYVETLSS